MVQIIDLDNALEVSIFQVPWTRSGSYWISLSVSPSVTNNLVRISYCCSQISTGNPSTSCRPEAPAIEFPRILFPAEVVDLGVSNV